MIDYEEAARTAPNTGNTPFMEGDQDALLLITASENFNGRNGNKYIIKGRVLEVKATGTVVPPPVVGADRSIFINLDRPKSWKPGDKDHGMANLMSYAYAINGGPPSGADDKEKGRKINKLLGQRAIDAAEAQHLRLPGPQNAVEAFAVGIIVRDRTVAGMTKGSPGNAPHPITYHNWTAVPEFNTLEAVLARKEALKAGQPIVWPPPKALPPL